LIHFWFYDETEPSSSIEDKYKLYMEVELIGPSHSKTPQSRSMGVSFAGLFRIFARHSMFMSSVDDEFQTTHITGGYAIPEMAAKAGEDDPDPFSSLALAKAFDNSSAPTNGDVSPLRSTGEGSFTDRMLPFIAYLAGFNASQRMSVVRTRLFNKISAVSDQTLGGLIPTTLSNAVFQNLQGESSATESYLDLINRFCGQVFYAWYQIPAPAFLEPGKKVDVPDFKTGKLVSVDTQPTDKNRILEPSIAQAQDRKVFSFIRDYYRNDFMFAPELFYAAPPPCNFIMPEDLTNLNYQRVFDNEPTRVVITDPYFEAKAAYFSPVTLLRAMKPGDRAKVSAAEFFGSNIKGLSEVETAGSVVSPYAAPPHTESSPLGKGLNLLSVLSEDELEKGIICSRNLNPFELFPAIASVFRKQAKGEEEVAESFESSAARSERLNKGEITEYERIMTAIADYRYQMSKAERQANITCTGQRWAVPGFSAIIFDRDASYLCFIESLTLSVDISTGVESTSFNLSKVRAIPRVSKENAEMLDKMYTEQQQKKIDIYSATKEKYQKKLEALDRAYLAFDKGVNTALGEIGFLETEDSILPAIPVLGNLQPARQLAKYIAGETVSLSNPTLTAMSDAAGTINAFASPVHTSLFSGSRTEAAQRFATQSDVPPNGAFLDTSSTGTAPLSQRELYNYDRYSTYAAGYLPLFKDGQFQAEAFVVDKAGATTTNTKKHLATVRTQAFNLVKQVKDYLQFQVTLADAAAKSGQRPQLDAAGDSAIAVAISSADAVGDEYVRSFFSELTGFPLPPTWFNKGFMLTSSIDQAYHSALGCQPFYGEGTEFGGGLKGAEPAAELTSKIVFDEYVNALKMLDRLFPILDATDGITPNRLGAPTAEHPKGVSKWESLNEQPELSPGPGFWIDRNLKRRQVMSLKWFLKVHGLKIKTELSDAPVREPFWVMEPVNAKDENTIFDFIVDEWEKFPSEAVQLRPEGVLDTTLLSPLIRQLGGDPQGGDPLVKELRIQVKESDHPTAPFLFRAARQVIIKDYARRHFGSRAFDGR
jgi:hypothetical protein